MFTYKFFVRGGHLQLRLRNNGVKAEQVLPLDIPDQAAFDALLTPKGMRSKPGLRYKLFCTILESIKDRLFMEDRLDEHVSEIRRMFIDEIGVDGRTPDMQRSLFMYWFRRKRDSARTRGTRSVYDQTLSKILKCVFVTDIEHLKITDIDHEWLTMFDDFCLRTATRNSTNIHLRNIRAIINYAVDNGHPEHNPFRRFKVRPQPTAKRSLTVEELRELAAIETEPYAEIYRDMFMLMFCLIGINPVDLYSLVRITRAGRVEYTRAKTGALYSIRVEPEARDIIDRYRGQKSLLNLADRWSDHRNFIHQCDKGLKRIGDVRIGKKGKKDITSRFPDISLYWARHTWGTLAYELDVPKDIISQALGHSSGSSTTEIYIRRDTKKVDKANRMVLDWVFKGVEKHWHET